MLCNPAVTRVFGYAPEELIGQPMSAISTPDAEEYERVRTLKAHLREQTEGNGEPLVVRFHRKSGEEFPAEVVISVLRDQQGLFIGFVLAQPRHQPAGRAGRGAAQVAAHGGDRPAHRRHRPRLQQPADHHHRQPRAAGDGARRSRAEGPAGARQQRRADGRAADQPAAHVRPPPRASSPSCSISTNRCWAWRSCCAGRSARRSRSGRCWRRDCGPRARTRARSRTRCSISPSTRATPCPRAASS